MHGMQVCHCFLIPENPCKQFQMKDKYICTQTKCVCTHTFPGGCHNPGVVEHPQVPLKSVLETAQYFAFKVIPEQPELLRALRHCAHMDKKSRELEKPDLCWNKSVFISALPPLSKGHHLFSNLLVKEQYSAKCPCRYCPVPHYPVHGSWAQHSLTLHPVLLLLLVCEFPLT